MQTENTQVAAGQLLRPVQTKRASEAIYEQIKELIVSGQLKPGDRLPSERNMMDQFQRSRPTIREALRMLERTNFIRTIPGVNGAIIQEPSTQGMEQSMETMLRTSQVTLDELAEYRSHNDTAVAHWAAIRRTEEDLANLEQALEKARQLIDAGDYDAFIREDATFHMLLSKAAKNEVASIISRVMSQMSSPILAQAMGEQSTAERDDRCRRVLGMHRNIFEAVRVGDVEAAEQAMAVHIDAFMNENRLLSND